MTEIKDTKGSKSRAAKVKKKEPGQDRKTRQKKDPPPKQENTKSHKQEKDSKGEQDKKRSTAFDEFGNQVEKIAVKTAESIRKVVDKALASRNTVLTIRVNDDSNKKMNMLVDAGLFKSRSESAAFLIQEGIKSQNMLFDKISEQLDKIEKIREELNKVVTEEFRTIDPSKKS
ncbi:MAG: hypothetical protein PVH84_16040 [Candidatus Aminicenantes bacterium]|jgi:hypothetical protein